MDNVLQVKDLNVSFKSYLGTIRAVRGVNFVLNEKETLAMVGESGCGKTVTAKSILKLFGRTSGNISPQSQIWFDGQDILKMSKNELSDLRGAKISMILQDSMTSLNPTMRVGKQIAECIRLHNKVSREEAMKRACDLLRLVEIPNPEERLKNYPHQMSGGMRQRVMIAMALSCNPKILIADEPTTALDVTIQAQLIDLLKSLREKMGMSVILVTHDLGVVADFADRIQVMYAGNIVERGTKEEIFKNPKHPYTWALLDSIPSRNLPRKGRLYSLKGTPPNLSQPITGCPFAARCKYCMPVCRKCAPQETSFSQTHQVSCWLNHPMAPQNVWEGESR